MLYTKTHKALSLFICFIPASLVAGAAVMEFFIALTCFAFLFLNIKNIGLKYYKQKFSKFFLAFCLFLILSSIITPHITDT